MLTRVIPKPWNAYPPEFQHEFQPDGNVPTGAGISSGWAKGGSLTVTPNTVAPIPWTSGGPAAYWTTGSKFTAPQTGRYWVIGSADFSGSDYTAAYLGDWHVNGDRTLSGLWQIAGSCPGFNVKVEHADTLILNAGDYCEFCVSHNEAATRTVTGLNAFIQYQGAT